MEIPHRRRKVTSVITKLTKKRNNTESACVGGALVVAEDIAVLPDIDDGLSKDEPNEIHMQYPAVIDRHSQRRVSNIVFIDD